MRSLPLLALALTLPALSACGGGGGGGSAAPRPAPHPGLQLSRLGPGDAERYRTIYRRIGERWFWFARLGIGDAALQAILADPGVEAYEASLDGAAVGLLELDFRQEGEAEIVYFGLMDAATGKGAGRWLMNRALEMASTPAIAMTPRARQARKIPKPRMPARNSRCRLASPKIWRRRRACLYCPVWRRLRRSWMAWSWACAISNSFRRNPPAVLRR